MKKIHVAFLVLGLASCNVNESENKSQTKSSAAVPSSGLTKEDIKGVWTSGETENASVSIEEDSILFVDTYTYVRYELRDDTLLYIEDSVPFFKSKVIKADEDSLVLSNEDGIRRLWRFKE